ncbi:MAG: hypothetical protein QOF89_2761 [Acidobacteriota bacterium]|jgi:hypothetical protein|nr:hypothetical protein [Acidobacteriota bacterium]
MTPHLLDGEVSLKDSRERADRIDALLWLVVPVLLLFTIPIGFVSNDGLGHSLSFASGGWRLNPNHLLFEPLGAWWQNAWAGSGREPVDALKLLSALSGALAAALFRWGVAPRVAETRWAANHATAWLALSSAFLRLWVSDETHMIQMPFVVAVAWLALIYLERPTFGRILALGVAVGLAALTYISNLLLGVALGVVLSVWHLRRREPRLAMRNAVALGLGTALAAGPVFLLAWPGAPGFLAWLIRYGGGHQSPRVELAYGLVRSWRGLEESVLRALYGTASALVDLTPLAAAVRDRQAPSPEAVFGALAFLAAAATLLYGLSIALAEPSRPSNRGALLLTISWLAAILGFGIFWNNSDDQFYFQMAPVFGVLAARMTGRRSRAALVFLTLSLAGLLWNLIDVGSHRVLYPRQERMALLEREVRGACLVVYPGFDEPELLLRMSRTAASVEQLAITQLSIQYPADEGMRTLRSRIEGCRQTGGRVVLLDLFDLPPQRNPWKFLQRLGYDHAGIALALEGLPMDRSSRRVGPFTVRTVPGGF